MATQRINNPFPSLTHGGIVNIRAKKKENETISYSSFPSADQSAKICYEVPHDEVYFYETNIGIEHPELSGYYLSSASYTQSNFDCGTLCETYTQFRSEESDFNPVEVPDNEYSADSSEFTKPLVLSDRFWLVKPSPPEYNGETEEWECKNAGEIADPFKGYIFPQSQDPLPIGGTKFDPDKHLDYNSFPPCHPKFGIDSIYESGIEWVCVEYDVEEPCDSDIAEYGDLHTIQDPQGFCTVPNSGKWLYSSFNYVHERGDIFGKRVRVWRYNKDGWDPDQYG